MLIGVLLAVLAAVQVEPPAPRVERLPCGLRVVIREDHTLPLASVQLWYGVGSACDAPSRAGMCHVTRTLLEDRDDAALRLRAAGVRFESKTLNDACYFASTLPPGFLEYVLQVEARRMQPLTATRAQVAAALAAAAREWGSPVDEAEARAERLRRAALFPDHPYQRPPGFVAEPLGAVEPDDVDEFAGRWFTPTNATLVIVGDVSDVAALELVRKHFGGVEWADRGRRPEAPSPAEEAVHLPPVAGRWDGLEIAWLTPGAGDFDNATIDVLMQRLCNPVDGPLAARLAKLGVMPPWWRRETWREHGVVVLELCEGRGEGEGNKAASQESDAAIAARREQPGNEWQEVERAVNDELERAVGAVPTEIEVNRARALALREALVRRESFAERALDVGWHEVVAGDAWMAEFAVPRLAGVTVPELQRAAAMLREARTVYMPRVAKRDARSPDAESDWPNLPAALKGKPLALLDSAAALEFLAGHVAGAPEIRSPQSPATVTTDVLDNGVKVTVCSIPGLELAEVRTYLRPERVSTDSTEALMAVGSTRRSLTEIRDYLAYHGLELYPLISAPGGLRARGPIHQIPQMVELQAELIRSPECSDAACAAAVEQTRDFFQRARDVGWEAERECYLPPGLIGWLAGIFLPNDSARIKESLKRLAEAQEFELLVVGDVAPKDAFAAVEMIWSDWRPNVAASRPASGRRPAAPPETQPVTAISTSAGWMVREGSRDSLAVNTYLWPTDLDQPLRDFAEQCVQWSLGCPWPIAAELDAQHRWAWTTVQGHGLFLAAMSEPAAGTIGTTVERCLNRIEQVRFGRVPERQVATALRMARAERLVSLGCAARIADLMERGVTNPWDLLDTQLAADLAPVLSRVFRVQMRSVVGIGPDDHFGELQRFNHERPATTSAPAAP